MTNKYRVGGMSCAACSARVEGAVSHLDGVDSCSVNLLTGEMLVEGDVSVEQVESCVRDAGYTAALIKDGEEYDALSDDGNEGKRIALRLWISIGLVAVLMYFSMGHMMGAPLPGFLLENPVLIALIQLALCLPVLIINNKFFVNGVRGVIHLAPNMDTLVALGSFTSFAYSIYVTVTMIIDASAGLSVMDKLHGLYYESAAMILALITVGKLLEARAKGRTTNALRSLLMLKPKRATLLIDGREIEVDAADVRVGDIFVVRAGDSIPTDGEVISGSGSVDGSMLTGESMPEDKGAGDKVYAATVNLSGYMVCRATEVGEATALAGIIKMVKDASSTKAPIAKLADRVSGVFVPLVLGIALVTLVGWLIADAGIGYAIARAVSVLVISCPCALGLATPVAIMVGSGVGARRGILFKTAAALEAAGRIRTVVLDKTGTVTLGRMSVTDIHSIVSESELLGLAYSLESYSEHPLGAAVVRYAEEFGVSRREVSDFETLPGKGVKGVIDGSTVLGVSYGYASELCDMPGELGDKYLGYASRGKTPIVFIKDGAVLGMLAISDGIKPGAAEAVSELKSMGIEVVMLTGDNAVSAGAVAEEVGIERVIAGVLPGGKADVVRSLMEHGSVAMVGDGINDAPSLTASDLGIAVGCGTDIAIESGDVVLMRDDIRDIPASIALGRAVLMNIRENLTWAFLYNMIGIPMAAGLFGMALDPMFGAFAMSLSSFSVVMNALRLNLWRPRSEKRKKGDACAMPEGESCVTADKASDNTEGALGTTENCDNNEDNNTEEKEINKVVKVIKVEGMMCPHCEARVKKVLEAFDFVSEAVPSHTDGQVTVTVSEGADLDALVNAIIEAGYEAEL